VTGMRLSVAMCTYNGAAFISEQLRSILSQERPPDEMVVCDDGSDDDTASLLRAISDQAPFPLRVFSNERRLGPAKNFERAILHCDGDIIVLSDQDDIWRPEKLKKLEAAFESNPDATYAFSDGDMVNESGEMLGQTIWSAVDPDGKLLRSSGANQLRLLLKQNLIPGASMAFRKSFRDVIFPIPIGWMHDYWIALLGSTLSRGLPIPDRLLMYRRHAAQTCGWRKSTFGQAVRESIATSDQTLVERLEQFREILRRIAFLNSSVQCSKEHLDLLMQKEAHLLKRAQLRSAGGLLRVAAVFAEAATGRYQRFSNSWLSIARDLR
jgi:glycosyltransferase involved in cell wall biosynthesis